MIRNIIFDIGKVLVSYEPDAYMDRLGLDEKAKAAINQAMFQNKLWDESDQGLGTPEELLQKFIAGAPEYAEEITKIHQTVGETVELMPYAMEWILDLKARGYHTYYLSNYGERIRREASKELSFLSHMDGGIMSYTVHLAKPDPAIYQTLLDRYGLKAEECVFLDDTVRNVEAAQALGIAGIVVTSQEQAKKELETLL